MQCVFLFDGSLMLFLDLFNSCTKPTWYNVFQDVVFERLSLVFFRIYNDIHDPVLFCSSLDPNQLGGPRLLGMSSCLMSILHFSRSFNDVQISSIPKNFPMWALLNQFCALLLTRNRISLRLNSPGLLLPVNKEDFFIF